MQTGFKQDTVEPFRAELEAVLKTMGRSSRLAILLRYLCEKYFEGQADQLSEYCIATEVFGRSKTAFDASEDAIARVEAHRLRKRLKEYYEGPGQEHSVQIALPSGTYVPVFTQKAEAICPVLSQEATVGTEPYNDASPADTPPEEKYARPGSQTVLVPDRPAWFTRWRFVLLIVTLATATALLLLLFNPRFRRTTGAESPGGGSAPAGWAGQSLATAAPMSTVRILAGYTGDPQTDGAGSAWGPDRYVHGGGTWRLTDGRIARTSDPFLFQHWRGGDSRYDIPLKPGVYELHLYFVASEAANEEMPTFTVWINGKIVLPNFDIETDALGPNIADERILRDVSPASDGKLHLAFTNERGAPEISAIEIVPGLAHKQLPIRLLMQRTPYTDRNGNVWRPDDYFMYGQLSDLHQPAGDSSDPDLFSSERYGHFTYAIPVDTSDRYTLVLHFVEFYFGADGSGGGGVGSRVFKVMCNGQTLLDHFDIYKEAGRLHVLTKTFYHLKPSAQGKLNLTFEPIVNNATVSGIEVLDEGP